MTGVIWKGSSATEVLDRANLAIDYLKENGKKVFLVSNNSVRARGDYEISCRNLGINVLKVRLCEF